MIKNNKRMKLSKVKLSIPDVSLVTIKRGSKILVINKPKNPILIGDMDPLEKIQVIAWTSVFFFPSDVDDIRITHDNGIGKINVKITLGGIWPFLSKWWLPILSSFAFVICLGMIFKYSGNGDKSNEKYKNRENEE